MIECLKCLPCISAKKSLEKGAIKGKEVCPGWRMAPGVFAVAACIVGIVYCLLKKNPYVCIPFGVGTLASLYFIYLGYEYKDLQTLHQSSKEIKSANEVLKSQVEAQNEENRNYKNQNELLMASNQSLAVEIGSLQEHTQRQKEQLIEQQKTNEELQAQTVLFQSGLTKMSEHLDSEEGNLEGLRRVLGDFQNERQELAAICEKIINLLAPSKTSEYREACAAWAKLQSEIEAASSQLPQLKSQVETLRSTISQLIGYIEELGENTHDLTKIKEELQALLHPSDQK